jgi:NAD(P)-dependent dehydrogenase (short-subunit alcohol dehydrogenase family)
MDISFTGQVVVITGGGGGLGGGQARELARRGASVVVNDVGGLNTPDGPTADAVVAEIEAAGGKAVASHDSIATPDGGRAVIELALDTFGTVDAVLHYAGAWRHVLVDDLTADQLDPVLDVHLRGAAFVTQPAWPIMKAKGYGRIVLVSSSAGVFGRQWGANYAAAKSGLLGFGRALALEGEEHGIFANCLLPIAKPDKPGTAKRPPEGLMEEFKKSGLPTGPHPPGATPAMVPAMATYLASRACTVNGEAFSACAGRYARVFVGLADGWLCDAGEVPRAEDIAAHLDEIEDLSAFMVPKSVHEEVRAIAMAIAARDGTDL